MSMGEKRGINVWGGDECKDSFFVRSEDLNINLGELYTNL